MKFTDKLKDFINKELIVQPHWCSFGTWEGCRCSDRTEEYSFDNWKECEKNNLMNCRYDKRKQK